MADCILVGNRGGHGGSSVYPVANDGTPGTPTGDIKMPNNVTSIANELFKNNTGITSISFSTTNNALSLGDDCFQGCSNLEELTLPDNINNLSIGRNAFKNCSKLSDTSVNSLLSKSTSMDYEYGTQFSGCNSIVNIITPCITKTMFTGCQNLTSVIISGDLEGSGIARGSAFMQCSKLQSVVFDNVAIRELEYNMFYGCSKLSNIVFPNGLTIIGNSAFAGCNSLTSIVIPHGVTTIGAGAFMYCTSLASISLPNTIDTLDASSAFYGCTTVNNVQLGSNWDLDINLSFTNSLTRQSMLDIMNSLADLSGQTSKTLTLGTSNRSRLQSGDENIATNKNWIIA